MLTESIRLTNTSNSLFNMKVYSSLTNRLVDINTSAAVDRLLTLRNTKSQWDVIDEVIKIWYTTHPKEWKSHLIEMKDLKETRKNKFASTKDKSLRFILDIPEKVILIIRKLYSTDECPMDKRWMLKFARRYPKFVVAERV